MFKITMAIIYELRVIDSTCRIGYLSCQFFAIDSGRTVSIWQKEAELLRFRESDGDIKSVAESR
jgi:hypothetical protein